MFMNYWLSLKAAFPSQKVTTSIDRKHREAGFTLIEIMVVIAIIGILATLIVPKIMGRPDEARATAAKHDVGTLVQSLKLYRLDVGRYPTTEQGIKALVERPTSEPVPEVVGKATK
jgi:general secretion pathway protein G